MFAIMWSHRSGLPSVLYIGRHLLDPLNLVCARTCSFVCPGMSGCGGTQYIGGPDISGFRETTLLSQISIWLYM